jgi:hypothetical protein
MFAFSVTAVSNLFPVNINISNDFVNFNSTMKLVVNNLTEKIIISDYVKIIISQEINVYAGTCVPLQCVGCLCMMAVVNETMTQTVIWISNFPTEGISSLSLNI